MPYYECPACGLTVHSAAAYSSASVCPNCSAMLPVGAKVFPAPGAGRDISRVFDASPDAPAAARRSVVGMPVAAETRANLELLVSELVTNALLHGGRSAHDPITLKIAYNGDHVRLAIHDCGSGFTPRPIDGHDPLAAGGRGCKIVEALSDDWGVDCDDDGCTVWCEVELDGAPDSAAVPEPVAGVHRLAVEMARPAGPEMA